ncbi:MAG: PAS domain-containing protein [Deltaproteobacteria bacterium]|nr:PAS domain-containing protein [Deltaproteobacteria bacterium]
MTDELAEVTERLALSRDKFYTLTMALARTLGEGIVLRAMDGKVVQANKAYQDMLGYNLKQLHKKTYQELTPAKWHEMEEKLHQEQVMQRGWCEVYEKEYIKSDGTVFPVRTQAWLVRDESGRPLYLLGIVRDISGEAAA